MSNKNTEFKDTYFTRLHELVYALLCIPGTEDMIKLREYEHKLSLREQWKDANRSTTKLDSKHKNIMKTFIKQNINSLKHIKKNLKFKGIIKFDDTAEIDLETIFNMIQEDKVKSDFLQYIFGILEKLQPGLFDIEEKIEDVIDIFGEGTLIELDENTGGGSSEGGSIDEIFGGDTEEDKFIRNFIGNFQKKTRGSSNPMSMIGQMANPSNMRMIMNMMQGRKNKIKVKRLAQKLADAIPDDAEI